MPGPPTSPAQGSEPLGLKIRNQPNRITRRGGLLQRSYRSQLDKGPIRWARTSESNPLYTSVDASRPHAASADNAGKKLVEPPGIAPGSGPLITSAFIAIVRPKPDRTNIGASRPTSKSLSRRRCAPSPCPCRRRPDRPRHPASRRRPGIRGRPVASCKAAGSVSGASHRSSISCSFMGEKRLTNPQVQVRRDQSGVWLRNHVSCRLA